MADNYAPFFIDQAYVSENAFLTQPSQGLTVTDIINDLLLLWGIAIPSTAPAYQINRAIHDMNGALQMIWATAKDANYFSRQTLTLAFTGGEASQSLPENVLTILGPCRYQSTGQPLLTIPTRSQFDAYGPIYGQSLTYPVATGAPFAFWVEKLNISAPDNVTNIIHLVPTPSSSTTILLDVSIDAPRYVWQDYITATPVQFPHMYCDTVLIPFCRYRAMTSYLLPNPDIRPALVEDWQTAMKIIGAVDPNMKEVQFAERASDRAAA